MNFVIPLIILLKMFTYIICFVIKISISKLNNKQNRMLFFQLLDMSCLNVILFFLAIRVTSSKNDRSHVLSSVVAYA